MVARIARYEVAPEKMDQTVAGFRAASEQLLTLAGLEYGQVLIDRESGGVATVVFWANRQAMEASGSRARALRQQAISAGDGSVVSVSEYEVAFEFRP